MLKDMRCRVRSAVHTERVARERSGEEMLRQVAGRGRGGGVKTMVSLHVPTRIKLIMQSFLYHQSFAICLMMTFYY